MNYKILAGAAAGGILASILLKVFSGEIILPQFFAFGPLTIHYYGITMALAVMAGAWLAEKRKSKYLGEADFKTDDLLLWLVIVGFVFARLYHIASSFGYYSQHPLEMLKVWNGGLSIYGALLGGVIVLLVWGKIFNLKSQIFKLLDWLAPSFLLGQIIGRLGNLFNYEAYGYPTNLPWKMYVPPEFRPAPFAERSFFHPLFLYELAANAAILAFLLRLSDKKKLQGNLFFMYLLLYNTVRFFLEYLRVDSTYLGTWRLNAIASGALVVIALAGISFLRTGKNEKAS